MNNLNSIVDYLKVFNNINKRPAQEPRTMAQAPLANDLEPGSLKDEMSGNFDPSQETHEEYLQRINLDRPFNAAHGGRIGYDDGKLVRGPRGGDRKLLDQLIEEANKGFKLAKMKDLQVKAGYNRSTNLMGTLDTLETKMKKAFEHVMGDPNKLVTEMFDPMTQVNKLIGVNDSPGRILKGWAPYEESKRLIKNLAVPLSKQRLSKVGDLTLGELDFRISNNAKEDLLYSPPRKVTNETKIFDIVNRHVNQGGKELEWITKPGKTELGYPSYSEAKFKYNGKTYDMAELIKNAETDPNFKEFFKAQNEYKKINGEIVKHPKTGKNIKFGDLMQEVYGYKRPYAVDHAGSILKEPFSNLRVLPQRINAAAGNISHWTDKFIVDPLKKGKYTEAGKTTQLEKIGYNFNQSIDDLIKAEMNLANDVLVKGRTLRTPNQIIDSLRQGENYVPDFYTKDSKPGSGFAKQLEKGKVPKAVKPGGGVQLSSGFGALDDLVKSPGAKKIGTIARKTLLSDWVWPEIALGGAEYINRLQKGQTDRAKGETLELASLGLYDSGATEEAILEQAKKLGYGEKDIKALEHMMRYNKIGKEIKNTEAGIESMEGGYTPFSTEKGSQQLKEKLEDLKQEQKSVSGFYFGAIGDKDANYGTEIYSDAVTALGNEEFNRTLDDRLTRRDPYAGGIGNWLQNNIFTLDAQGRTAEQERIDAMSPQELREFNVQRGVLPVGPTHGAYDHKKFEDLQESLDYMYAEGGIAGLKKK